MDYFTVQRYFYEDLINSKILLSWEPMPKVSEYDLEHFEEELERPQKIKKHKKIEKDKKRSDKKDYRAEWRKQQRLSESSKSDEGDEE